MNDPASEKMESPWQLSKQHAQLALSGVEASLDLAEPAIGISSLSILGRHVHASVLGARYADHDAAGWGALIDQYERGEDLVAVYDQTDRCPFRTTLYWRAEGGLAQHRGVTLDLIVSVQTNLLDVTPRLVTRSWFADAEAVLFPPAADRKHLDLDRALPPETLSPGTEVGCAMLRLAELDATYCELIHPSDWRGLDVRPNGDQVELSWSLVGHFLEKGVIRRLRVRGIFLAGRAKEHLVDELYAEFAESPPPLTT